MSVEERRSGTREPSRATDAPAVGLAVTPPADSDVIAGAILRARRAGHDVLVGAVGTTDCEACAFVNELDARLIDVDARRTDAKVDPSREVVAGVAREVGYPGLLWQADPTQRVDFDRSVDHLRTASEYCVATVPRPAVASTPRVLAAIPAYNEADSTAAIVGDVRSYADNVLVIDDGSTDATADRAREAGATVVEHGTNRGYGAALKTAFREAERSDAEHLVILDGDGQHDPSEIPALVATQRERNAELVVGCRFDPDADTDLPLYRRVGLAVVNVTTNLTMGVVRPSNWIRDTQCGFRAYDRRAIRSLADADSIGSHMGASTDILHHARAQGYRIVEAPASVDYEADDTSTHGPIQHGITLIMNLVRTIEEQRPITILGIPGTAAVLLGVWLAYWTFSNFIRTGSFPLGLALTSSFFTLVGVFACFTAIILHALQTQLPDT